jgi:hypothetical protein
MKQAPRIKIYNSSCLVKIVTIGSQSRIVMPNTISSISKPEKDVNIIITDENGFKMGLLFPVKADTIFITDFTAATNLTAREGTIENRSSIPIICVEVGNTVKVKKCLVTPCSSSKITIVDNSHWLVVDPASGDLILGNTRSLPGNKTLVFDGITLGS